MVTSILKINLASAEEGVLTMQPIIKKPALLYTGESA
jgi:hypothetical protein